MPDAPPRDPRTDNVRELRPPAIEAPPPQGYEPADERQPPSDPAAERAVLGAILLDRQALADVADIIEPADFYRPAHEAIYAAALHLFARLDPVDAITVGDHLATTGGLQKVGGRAFLFELAAAVATTANAGYYAGIVAKKAKRRRVVQTGMHLQHAGYAAPDDDVDTLLTTAAAAITAVRDRGIPGIDPDIPGLDIDTFLAVDDSDEPAWLIPGFLERRDRCILTATEGGGKSTLLRQWAVQAALGEHPFTKAQVPPISVLLLDLENSERQTRRALRPLRIQARGLDPARLTIICKPDGLDLTTPSDTAWLDKLLSHYKPDLLVTGPIYKLAGGNPNDEVDAKPAALTIDALRAKHDLAVLLEAHTRKGDDHDRQGNARRRPKEPFGWSGWMRWPEIGIHLSADGDLTHWRGLRDADIREFPELLLRGGKWPWMPAESPDEARFHVIRKCVQDAGEELSQVEIAKRTGIPRSSIQRILGPRSMQWQAVLSRVRIDSQAGAQ